MIEYKTVYVITYAKKEEGVALEDLVFTPLGVEFKTYKEAAAAVCGILQWEGAIHNDEYDCVFQIYEKETAVHTEKVGQYPAEEEETT